MAIAAVDPSGRENKLGSLLDAARQIARPKGLNEKAEEILRECSRMTGARGGSLYIQEGSVLRLSACLDPGHAARSLGLPLSESSILARVERTRAPLLIRAFKKERGVTRSSWMGYKDGSALLFPLLDAREDILGIVALHNKKRPPFTARDLDRGSILCSFGGEALALHRSEMSLTGSERPYREVFEHSSSGIVIWEVTPDQRFRLLSLNPALERMTGISSLHASGRFVEDILSEETASKVRDNYRLCIAEGAAVSIDSSLDMPAGHVIFHTTYIPLRDATGRIHRLIALPIDNTERNRAEQELRESEARYREIVENTSDGVFVVEVTEDRRFRLLSFNPAQERMLGLSAGEARGGFVEEYLPREMADLVIEGNRRCIEAGQPMSFERTFETTRGHGLFHTTLVPIRDEVGCIVRLVGITRDLTEHAILEERDRERERQALQAAKLATLGTLVSGIAHEINNPNNFIRLNTWNIRQLWGDIRPILHEAGVQHEGLSFHNISCDAAIPMIESLLAGIEEGSQRIDKLLGDLRKFALDDEGDLMEDVEVNDVIKSAIMMTHDMIQKSSDAFSFKKTPGLPLVHGSYHQIEQVFINLIANACQSLPSRDCRVSVATSIEDDGGWIRIEVADEGSGIPAENMPRLTDPFFTTKRAGGGTGLGLAVSSRIVSHHGGTMSFSSDVGKGTRVTVRLPAAGRTLE
jgi:PAS domain S-box-containing protein